MKSSIIYVFGYGSLINPKSIQRTLGREIRVEDLLEARIHDYIRKWQLVDWVLIEGFDRERSIPAIFLDIVWQPGAKTNGILIPLSVDELHKMGQRERNYDRIYVSTLIEPSVSEHIYTYIGKKEYITPPKESCVLVQYENMIEEGLHFWGKEFEQQYYESTLSHHFPRKKGKYIYINLQ